MARQTATLLSVANLGAANVAGNWVPIGDVDTLTFLLVVSVANSIATDTLDVYIDGSFNGVTTNLIHFPQVVGGGGSKRYLAALSRQQPSTAPTDVTGDAGAGVTRNYGIPDRVVARAVGSGGTASFSFMVVMSGV